VVRDPDRIPAVLAALERRWKEQPDLRLGQLLVALLRRQISNLSTAEEGRRLFNVEDSQLLEWLEPGGEDDEKYARDDREPRSSGWFGEAR
jgi:hypothetical protein